MRRAAADSGRAALSDLPERHVACQSEEAPDTSGAGADDSVSEAPAPQRSAAAQHRAAHGKACAKAEQNGALEADRGAKGPPQPRGQAAGHVQA